MLNVTARTTAGTTHRFHAPNRLLAKAAADAVAFCEGARVTRVTCRSPR